MNDTNSPRNGGSRLAQRELVHLEQMNDLTTLGQTRHPSETRPSADEIAAKRDVAMAFANGSKSAPGGTIVAISAAKMDNLGEWVTVGTIRLLIRALPIKKAAELSECIEQSVPSMLVYAALADENGVGIDPVATAAFWSEVNAVDDQSQVTPTDVAGEIRSLTRRVISETTTQKPAPGYDLRVVDALSDALYMVADTTPGLTRAALPTLIEDDLSVPQLADVVRILFLSVGGFPGDMADRFASPS